MNLHREIQRIWALDPKAATLCPPEKVFAALAPDKYVDQRGELKPLNVPYVVTETADSDQTGGTSNAIEFETILELRFFTEKRAEGEALQKYSRALFENQDITLNLETERFQDISADAGGEFPPENGVYKFFQRFIVKTSIQRPKRKG